VFLAHQPRQIELARGLGVGLQLSGTRTADNSGRSARSSR
jgi:hypothetical protein